MKILGITRNDELATVYVADMGDNKIVEFVESVQPPISKEDKWILIVSTLYGCPVSCKICDAGGEYKGRVSREDILDQIDFMVRKRFLDNNKIQIPKFKIQFARMGEPSYNPAVLDVLEQLPSIYDAPGLLPSLSTVAPRGTEPFFDRLIEINKEIYKGSFQLQFSIHTTDYEKRRWLIPKETWSLGQIAEYGLRFYVQDGKKISLNFALAKGFSVDPNVIRELFNPNYFLVKITPVNPTFSAADNCIESVIQEDTLPGDIGIVQELEQAGYQVIFSRGEFEENKIGSNCGQHVLRYKQQHMRIEGSYTYLLDC